MKAMLPMIALVALSACSSGEVKENLGLVREAPDEFVVVSRPSLSVPPEFNLVPPEPGKLGPRHSTEDMAKDALFGTSTGAGPSGLRDGEIPRASILSTVDKVDGEFGLESIDSFATSAAVAPVSAMDTGSAATSNFLSKTGAAKADPEIRAKLGKDAATPPPEKEEAKSLFEKITGAEKDEPVLDAKGEAERLRANKNAGKKPNVGDVVTEEKKKKSVLDAIW